MTYRLALYVLLITVAAARLMLHVAAMPPYAGLDELYHTAYLAFVLQEGRAPTTNESSIPRYLHGSIRQEPTALPSFAEIGARWPEVIRDNPEMMTAEYREERRPYTMPNYEAQQPQVYYRLVAPLAHVLSNRTAIAELRLWRLVSVVFALVTVLATAVAGERLFGPAGLLAGAALVSMPTWLTLVARVGNDALACALVAAAFALSVYGPRRRSGYVAEGLLWALAAAVKLYTWPALVVLPLVWSRQRAGRGRMLIVVTAVSISALLTLMDLSRRTNNPLGVVAFDRPGGASLISDVDVGELVRVTIASGAWTSGQHWNALTPIGIAISFGPLLVAIAFGIIRCRHVASGWLIVPLSALITFGFAQAFNVLSCVLARRAGNPVPIGGKEGWYWYVLAPIVLAIVIPIIAVCRRWLAISIISWIVLIDIFIHEFALYRDYAGDTSPLHPSLFFRWGPLALPTFDDLSALRLVHLLGVTALLIVWRYGARVGSGLRFDTFLQHVAK